MGLLYDIIGPLAAVEYYYDIEFLAEDCSNSIANALELLQSCTKPSIYG